MVGGLDQGLGEGVNAPEIRKEVCRAYSGFADEYVSATHSYEPFPGLEDELRTFASDLPGSRFLDLGCGSGRDGLLLAKLGFDVVFADFSLPMLHHGPGSARARWLVCCDVLGLPFCEGAFSGVLLSGVLLHLPRSQCRDALVGVRKILDGRGRVLMSMKRGTGEGWRVAGSIPKRRWFSYYAPDEFAEICESARLVIDRVTVSDREDWFTVTAGRYDI
jgi:SAM-dependent methyltransferase